MGRIHTAACDLVAAVWEHHRKLASCKNCILQWSLMRSLGRSTWMLGGLKAVGLSVMAVGLFLYIGGPLCRCPYNKSTSWGPCPY